MKNILVSLVSDQAIPNVQLIKEFRSLVQGYLFISTPGMEKKNVREALINACKLSIDELLPTLIVDQFSFDDIEQKLDGVDFESFDNVYVNLTGGTKVMTLAAFDYFKEIGAEIYYITGQDETLIKVSPGRTKKSTTLSANVTLEEYFNAYGFDIVQSQASGISVDYTRKYFEMYTNGLHPDFLNIINELRKHRQRNKLGISKIENLSHHLNAIEFPSENADCLNKYEIKYLTGEWFEEYVSNRLKEELMLADDYIKTGIEISKINKKGELVKNELDVVFLWRNKIYVVECKTSVFATELLPDGSKSKPKSIIGETLYKSDSLKQGLGLFANTSIFILDSIAEYMPNLQSHLSRAELFGIDVVDKEAIKMASTLSSLLKIK
jgi:hypothetical protein